MDARMSELRVGRAPRASVRGLELHVDASDPVEASSIEAA